MTLPIEREMTIFFLSLAWVAAHALLFLLWGRRRRSLKSEKGILIYHVRSFVPAVAGSIAASLWLSLDHAFAVAVAVAGLHGVYSMTFLILWGSSDSGVSLRMLAELESSPLPRDELQRRFVRMGEAKLASRLPELVRGGFLRFQGEHYAAAPKGRVLAAGMEVLHGINNFRSTG